MTDVAQPLYPQPEPRLPIFNLAGATVRTFGRAVVPFVLLSALAALPTFVALTLFPPIKGLTWAYGVSLVVKSLVLYFAQIAMSYIAVRCLEGQSYSLGEAFALAVRRYIPVLLTMVLMLLAVFAGFILLFVPGVIVSLMFAVALPVCALEALGPIDSLKRSMDLTRNNRWRIFGAYVLFFLPIIILSAVIGGVTAAQRAPLAGQWANEIIQVLWAPFATIFPAAVYFALRRMKGYDGVAKVFD